jgi:hypothetical protein
VDGDHRDRAFRLRIADDGDDFRLLDHQAAGDFHRHFDEVAVAGFAEIAAVDAHFLGLAVDRDEAGAALVEPHDADLAAARLVENLHRLGGVDRERTFTGLDAREDAVAGGGNGTGILADVHDDARWLTLGRVPRRGEGVEVFGIGIGRDVERRDLWQRGRAADLLAGA